MLTRLEATTASANVVTMVKTAILVSDFVFCVKLFLVLIVRFSILKVLENLMCCHMMSHETLNINIKLEAASCKSLCVAFFLLCVDNKIMYGLKTYETGQ